VDLLGAADSASPLPREPRTLTRRRIQPRPVAESDDGLIGELSALGRAGYAANIGMSVAKEWRGRGVGTALMQACVDWARASNVHKLGLHVWPHSEAALRLYERFGFEREGVLRSHYRRQNGELWDAIVMGLLL
jgi:RimJ/RimL family protein N-acetyltransferase